MSRVSEKTEVEGKIDIALAVKEGQPSLVQFQRGGLLQGTRRYRITELDVDHQNYSFLKYPNEKWLLQKGSRTLH